MMMMMMMDIWMDEFDIIRVREDKSIEEATTALQLRDMFRSQVRWW